MSSAARPRPCICPDCDRARETFRTARVRTRGERPSPGYVRTLRASARNQLLEHNNPEEFRRQEARAATRSLEDILSLRSFRDVQEMLAEG